MSDSFVTPWTVACQAPLSMGFSRQEYWSRLPFPSLGHLPNSGIKPTSLTSPVLAAGFFTTAPPGKHPLGSSLGLLQQNTIDGHVCKEPENTNLKIHMYPYISCSSIYNSQDMEKFVSVIGWVDKNVVYILSGMPLSYRKEQNPAICEDMDGPRRY